MATKKTPTSSVRALSLHIGLNAVNPTDYEGWDGPLAACEFDAADMAAIAKSRGMKSTVLLTKKATRAQVLAAIRSAAKALKSGGLFFLTYSGHGGQIPDIDHDEKDRKDETWCLFDGQLIDDELYFELSKFVSGVRILILSDSCHSGSVARERPPTPPPGTRARLMPAGVANRVYQAHQAFYDKLQSDVAKAAGGRVIDPDAALSQVGTAGQAATVIGEFKPAVVLISGCQDNQVSLDGDHNGAFTEQLLKVWNRGNFLGTYGSFHARIRAGMPDSQSPNLFVLGPAVSFLKQAPFTV
ncbi:caspase family protein [Variovorax sp. J31P179]|uniref:caspase family protein n=1 Tax=Variovorax sp. J31P179 TaxID=3053508 RepID=UPI002574A192|nr:caspase family protein [Variovorax sp. J31P179]MDM0085724.1 caspase family protein [Variovorax sp. J31P179]